MKRPIYLFLGAKRVVTALLLLPIAGFAHQNGAAWTNIGPTPAAVETFAVDPQGSGTIFMGTISGGIRREAHSIQARAAGIHTAAATSSVIGVTDLLAERKPATK